MSSWADRYEAALDVETVRHRHALHQASVARMSDMGVRQELRPTSEEPEWMRLYVRKLPVSREGSAS